MTNLTKLNIALITIAVGSWLALGINGIASQVRANIELSSRDDSGYVTTMPIEPIQLNALTIEALVNVERAKLGLPALIHSDQLASSACAKLDYMVANNYWSHNAPDGTTPWSFIDAAGYRYTKASENQAYGQPTDSSVVEGWMMSPSHRANIVSENVEQGICTKTTQFQGGSHTVTVQHLGTR